MIGLPEYEGWADEGWVGAIDAGRPHESGGGGGRRPVHRAGGGRDKRDGQDGRGGADGRDQAGGDDTGRPEDRPWTPIPRQAKAAERGLIPSQRRLKKTSRSA